MNTSYVKLAHGKPKYEEYFVVNWCFFSICNFSCSYCPTDLHDGAQRGQDIEKVKKFCLQVINNKKGKKVFFEFTGGEMTYYKHFVELFQFLKDNGADTGMISNGSRDLNFWEKHKHLIDHICLSFHPEEGDADHFFNVVKLLNEVTTVHVNIMMLPEKFEFLHALANRIASEVEGVSVAMQALFTQMSGEIFPYTPEQKDILDNPQFPWGQNILYHRPKQLDRKIYRGEMKMVFSDGTVQEANPPEIIAKGENNWLGWKCHMGLENIVVNYHGQVQGGWCGVGGIIGNITDEDFKFPDQAILCTAPKCFCGLDIMSTKERN